MLPSDEVTPVPSTTSACAPLMVDVLAVVEDAELTYVADGEGLSKEVVVESAIGSTWLDNPDDQDNGAYHKLMLQEKQLLLNTNEEFPLLRS